MKIIKFEFCSKKYLNKSNKNSGVQIKGHAYFILDQNGVIIKQIAQISEGEYRRTDQDMINTAKNKGYWSNSEVRKIRNLLFPENNPQTLKKDDERITLNPELIEKINIEFQKGTLSCLSQLSVLAGSNVTGCDANSLAQPYFYINKNDGHDEWNLFNPFNCFKKIRKTGIKIELNLNKKHEFITLKEYFEKFPTVEFKNQIFEPKKLFENGNIARKLKNENNQKPFQSIKYGKTNQDQKQKKYYIKLKNYLEDIKKQLILYIDKIIDYDDDELKKFITYKFSTACNIAIEENKLKWHSFEKDNAKTFHNCHIISKHFLLRDKNNLVNLLTAASPFNCLRLSPTLHDYFDKNELSFTPDGKIVGNVNPELKNWTSKDITDNLERKKIVEENYLNWIKEHKNL